MHVINGDFRIQMEPHSPAFKGLDGNKTGRMSYRKAYQGKLEAVGIGEMLNIHCATEGHAGYVAIEQIKGTLDGRAGSFTIQHFGIKTPEQSDLRIDILPGSGTGDLTGILGTLTIRQDGKQHKYELHYRLADAALTDN